jgi:hypothetical protein
MTQSKYTFCLKAVAPDKFRVMGMYRPTVRNCEYEWITGAEGELCNTGTLQQSYFSLCLCELARETANSETAVRVLPTARGGSLSLLRPLFCDNFSILAHSE